MSQLRTAREHPNSITEQSGVAFLELLVVLPMLLVLGIGAIEVIRTAIAVKVSVQLSREAASIAFRDCIAVGESEEPADRELLQTCLRERAAIITNFNSIYGRQNVEIILSYFEVKDSEDGVKLVSWGTVGASNHPPKITTETVSEEISVMAGDRIVAAEIYVPHKAIVEKLGQIFSYDISYVYDSTIL